MSGRQKLYTVDSKTHKPVDIAVASSNGRGNAAHLGQAAMLGRRIIVMPHATLQHDQILAARAAAPPPPIPWLNPDVHARTPELRAQLLSEFPELPKITQNRAVVPNEIERVVSEIRSRQIPAEASACLDKIYGRRGAIDRDLGSVSVAGLLCVVWSDCVVPRIGMAFDIFVSTLCDMGTTCVQGDSHRLFATYVALKRDEVECAKAALHLFENPIVYQE